MILLGRYIPVLVTADDIPPDSAPIKVDAMRLDENMPASGTSMTS